MNGKFAKYTRQALSIIMTIQYFINRSIFNQETEGHLPDDPFFQTGNSTFSYKIFPLTLKARGNEVKYLARMLHNHKIKGIWMVSWPFGRLWEPFHVVKVMRPTRMGAIILPPEISKDQSPIPLEDLYAEWKELKFWAEAERVKPKRRSRV